MLEMSWRCELRALRSGPTLLLTPLIFPVFPIFKVELVKPSMFLCLSLSMAIKSALISTHILGLVMHLFNSKHKQNDLIAHSIKFYTYYTFSVCLQLDLC